MQRKFFVLVPVYKTEKFIEACIRSVLEQTYEHFRLILVDDGSPDRAGAICEEYAAMDSRITVIHQENGGQISARNAAMARMLAEAEETDFAVFLDSDDTLKPDALQILHNTIEKETCDMVIYGIDRVFGEKVLGNFDPPGGFCGSVTEKRELHRVVFLSSNYNPLCRKAISRKLVEEMSRVDYRQYLHIRLGEDLVQSLVLYEKCEKATFIPDRLYNYTDNPDSVSNNRTAAAFPVDSLVRQLVQSYLDKQQDWTKADMDAYYAYCRKRLSGKLRKVARLQASRQEKQTLLKKIGEDDYYQKLIGAAVSADIALRLLAKGRYGCLLGYLEAKNALVSTVKKLKKRLSP